MYEFETSLDEEFKCQLSEYLCCQWTRLLGTFYFIRNIQYGRIKFISFSVTRPGNGVKRIFHSPILIYSIVRDNHSVRWALLLLISVTNSVRQPISKISVSATRARLWPDFLKIVPYNCIIRKHILIMRMSPGENYSQAFIRTYFWKELPVIWSGFRCGSMRLRYHLRFQLAISQADASLPIPPSSSPSKWLPPDASVVELRYNGHRYIGSRIERAQLLVWMIKFHINLTFHLYRIPVTYEFIPVRSDVFEVYCTIDVVRPSASFTLVDPNRNWIGGGY